MYTHSIIGSYTGKTWTAAWVPLPGHYEIDNHWVYADAEGNPGCWSYRDECGYGPGLGYAADRHATPEAALAVAAERDVYAAAQGGALTREEYHSEVARLGGLQMWSDRHCRHMLGGDWDFPTYGVIGAAARSLASRRGRAVREETKAQQPSAEDRERMAIAEQIADLEDRAQHAEDNDNLRQASKLRSEARALRIRVTR
jgi:hypothetical protein